ncbi:MAG TPA: AI-2E family transporter, partial [Lachnospiraceae bacterium]|nr:AI-2E family transporter [Lachnospiraceae bacterium]
MNKRERFKKALQQPWAAMTFAACSAVVLFLLLSNLRVIGRGIGGLIGFVKPVLIGLIIAYVTDPLVVFFEQKVFRRVRQDTVRRGLGVLLTFFSIVLFIVLILVALIPQLISSVRLFISNLDSYSSAFSGLMQQLNDWASSHNVDISQYTSVGTNAVQLITSRLPKSVDGLLNTTITYGKNVFDGVIAVIIAIYFLMDKVRIRKGAHRLWKAIVSDSGYQKSNHFLGRCNEIMIRFILCDLLDGFIIGIANAAFMLVVGYPYVPLISVVVG